MGQIEQLKNGAVLLVKEDEPDENIGNSHQMEQNFNNKILTLRSSYYEQIPINRIYHIARASRNDNVFYMIVGHFSDPSLKYLVKGDYSTQKWSNWQAVTMPIEFYGHSAFYCIGSNFYTTQRVDSSNTKIQRRTISSPNTIAVEQSFSNRIWSANQSKLFSAEYKNSSPYGYYIREHDTSDFSVISEDFKTYVYSNFAQAYAVDEDYGYLCFGISYGPPIQAYKKKFELPSTEILSILDEHQRTPYYADFGNLIVSAGTQVCDTSFSPVATLETTGTNTRAMACLCKDFCGINESEFSYKLFIYESYNWASPKYLKCPLYTGQTDFEFTYKDYPY